MLGRDWRSTRIDFLQNDQVCGSMWRRDMEIFILCVAANDGNGKSLLGVLQVT